MILGTLAALIACVAYGVSSVLQALGARRSHAAATARGEQGLATATGAPTMKATIAAMLTVSFIVGTVLDVVGFAGGAVSARLTPLFLSQTVISANLIVTAVLGTVVLGIGLHKRDWVAIAVVIAALCALGMASRESPRQSESMTFHWILLIVSIVVVIGSIVLTRFLGSRAAIAAGLSAGAMFGVVAIAVRIADGLDPFDLTTLLSDPAVYALAVAGVGGFYVHTVALQLGSVNGATAALVVGETVVPGIAGVIWLGDSTAPGLAWLAVVGFIAAVVGAIVVAWSGAAEASADASTAS